MEVRNDLHPDLGTGDKANYAKGSTVKYCVGVTPGYLPRAKVLCEIARAFTSWSGASGLKFERVLMSEAQAGAHVDLRVDWEQSGTE